ncbi:MAG: electron transfer flavoprotein subunit beta/FixA family protein [Mycoplasmataceae bacterium]|jgi:electron transfer flavoprotein beta subunit|nr:electron transfer flavoprotein subunit beta/FixA family protein [Mycoplasmataceae bacterium]
MNILVCIKQVPASSNVKVDEKTGILIRDTKDTQLNTCDLFAVELALTIKREKDCISTITMGPPSAQVSLLETLSMGCDKSFLLTDKLFAGSDVLATAKALKTGISKIGQFDLILCGKQTSDGDTAQVGPEIAQLLNIPHATNVTKILELTDKYVIFENNLDEFIMTQKMALPCLLCADANINTPRLPSYVLEKKNLNVKPTIISVKDFDQRDSSDIYGLDGSPTKILQIYSPQENTNKTIYTDDCDTQSNLIVDILIDNKLI